MKHSKTLEQKKQEFKESITIFETAAKQETRPNLKAEHERAARYAYKQYKEVVRQIGELRSNCNAKCYSK